MQVSQNKLTDFEFNSGNTWLKHVFFPLVKDGDLSDCYGWAYSELDFEGLVPDAKKLYFAISNRVFDEQDELDAILNKFASVSYSDMPLGNFNGGVKIDFTASQIARILVNLCYNCELYWDNGSHTAQEKDYFEKTILGKAVKDLDCYLIPDAPQPSVSSPKVRQPRVSNGAANPWKQRGPLSDQARGLVGQPHNKIMLQHAIKIVDAVKSKTNKEIHAIVCPLSQKGDAGNNINKVLISDSNNNGDFLCIFNDSSSAQDFLNKIAPGYATAAPGRTLVAKSCSVDPNGYFEVATNYGNVYIKANGLNEDVQEDIEKPFVNPIKKLDDYTLEQMKMYNKD